MKTKMSVFSGLWGLLFVLLCSCNKTTAPPSQSSQITGKWIMKTAIDNNTLSGSFVTDTIPFTSADYFIFNADSTLFINATGSQYNGHWHIDGGKLYISGTGYMDTQRGFELPVLTGTDLQIYDILSTTSPPAYSELKLNLIK